MFENRKEPLYPDKTLDFLKVHFLGSSVRCIKRHSFQRIKKMTLIGESSKIYLPMAKPSLPFKLTKAV